MYNTGEFSGRFLSLDDWARKSQFDFFLEFELPFYNICADVDVSATLAWCKEHGRSFSMACWYACQQVVNELEPFRYRLRGDQVWVHNRVGVAATFLNADETFRFSYLPFKAGFSEFENAAREVINAPVTNELDDEPENDAVIHGSTLPWVSFTSVSHARRTSRPNSVPKIVFGKYKRAQGVTEMPVSVEVHHALMDGIHASRFFSEFEKLLSTPETLLV